VHEIDRESKTRNGKLDTNLKNQEYLTGKEKRDSQLEEGAQGAQCGGGSRGWIKLSP
jgi:hypothetical protein